MEEKIVVVFNALKQNLSMDLEIPLNITVQELITGLNEIFNLGVDVSDVKQCYLKTENPVMLLRGNRLLGEYGLHDGSIINFTK